MTIPVKKLNTGFAMPVFGLGTWKMGGSKERDLTNDDAADIAAIKTAINAGITHIDTAEIYANGYAETLVSEALKDYDRSKIFLVSKVQAANLAYDSILRSCEQSLQRLNTNYLDLYLLHRYNPEFPLKDSIRALDKLLSQGLIRNIGVSNFNVQHLTEAQSYTSNKIVCDQVHYNLEFREPEKSGLLKYCQKNDIFLVAWRPIGKGNLLQNIPTVLKEVCDKYQKTPAQIALNWLISQPNAVTLSKMTNGAHLIENLGAVGWQMASEDIEKLRHKYPNQQEVSNVAPLG